MYTNSGTGPISGTLSSGDLATLKSYVTAQQGAGGLFVGFSNAQIAAALNSSTLVANPQPVGTIAQASLPKTSVLSALLSLQLQASAAANTAAVSALSLVEGSVQGNPLDPIPAAQIQEIAALIAPTFSAVTAAVTAALNPSDPSWPATVQVSAWALTHLSAPTWLVEGDVAAALAS